MLVKELSANDFSIVNVHNGDEYSLKSLIDGDAYLPNSNSGVPSASISGAPVNSVAPL